MAGKTAGRSTRDIAAAFIVYLEERKQDQVSAAENMLTPVGADENSRYLVSLEDDGISCIPLIGEAHFRRRYRNAPLHMHPGCYEFTLCMRGHMEYECRGKKYRFYPGDIFAVGPDVPHRTLSFPKGLRRYRVLFRLPSNHERILCLPKDETEWLMNEFRSKEVWHCSDVGDSVRSGFQAILGIIRNIPQGTPERRMKLRISVVQLLLSIISAAKAPVQIHSANSLMMLADEMRSHPEREYSIDDIVSRLHMSSSSFLHKFKRATGLPPHTFLVECRMQKAKELLSNDVSVAATAHRCGFVSVKHFSTVFRHFTGVSPSRWK